MQGIVAGPPNSLAMGFFGQPEPCSRALELCVEPSSLWQGMDHPRHIGPGCKSLLPPGRGAFPAPSQKKSPFPSPSWRLGVLLKTEIK